jgi:hypothetical protein
MTQLHPPIPPPDGSIQLVQVLQTPGRGMAIASLVLGIIGTVVGIIPILFLFAWILGIVGLVLGVIAYRSGKKVGVKQGRAGAILCTIAIVMGIVGISIVNSAVDKLDHNLNCIGDAQTSAEIRACND